MAIGAIAVAGGGRLVQPKWAARAGDLSDAGPSGPVLCYQTDSEGVEWLLCFSQQTQGAYVYIAGKDRFHLSVGLRARMGIDTGGVAVRFGWDALDSAVVMERGEAAQGHQALHVCANRQSSWEVRSARLREFLLARGFKGGWLYHACVMSASDGLVLVDSQPPGERLARIYLVPGLGYERRDRYVTLKHAAKKRKVA